MQQDLVTCAIVAAVAVVILLLIIGSVGGEQFSAKRKAAIVPKPGAPKRAVPKRARYEPAPGVLDVGGELPPPPSGAPIRNQTDRIEPAPATGPSIYEFDIDGAHPSQQGCGGEFSHTPGQGRNEVPPEICNGLAGDCRFEPGPNARDGSGWAYQPGTDAGGPYFGGFASATCPNDVEEPYGCS